jgi:hypothetical protein
MKRIANAGRLKLNRETLRALSAPDMGHVNGGACTNAASGCVVQGLGGARPVGGNISPSDLGIELNLNLNAVLVFGG